MSDDVDPRPTGEVVAEQLFGVVKDGRREADWRAFFSVRGQVSLFFYLFGWLLDERHKPSAARLGLFAWTILGWRMVLHEIHLIVGSGQAPLQNAVWQAWYVVEGAFIVAVFGPRVASYFGPGAAGAVAAASLPSAVRDAIAWGRKEASALGHPGQEYDK